MAGPPILQEFKHSVSPTGYVCVFSPGWRCPAHFHGQLEILVLTRGELCCLIGNDVRTVKAPALIWHLPTVGHQTLTTSPDCFFWIAYVEPDFAEAVLGARLAATDSVRPLGSGGHGPFGSWILRLTNLVSAQPTVEIPALTALRLEELAFSASCAQTSVVFNRLLWEILSLAVDESERQLSRLRSASLPELGIALLLSAPELEREALCRALDVSASYLARQFQQRMGTTFADFRTRARVVSFLAAAAQGSTTLLDAALAAGFGSYSQAHRVFSKLTGYGPRHYLHNGGRDVLAVLSVEG